ncbi:phosphotransferase [Demequina salsinemoris]|uniref:phosphotransferase n=1 Tax=Demequina salsinemoris TaxID=577470 RepID=UPI000781BCBF|nr:phosphotransferase [Demequina salsinemoris]
MTDGPDLDDSLAAWVRARLGSPPSEVFFGARSMSDVVGVTLADGRRVALKRRGGGAHVLAAARAQRAATLAGIDCPALLAGPEEVPTAPGEDLGIVTAEEWRGDGGLEPTGDASRLYARLLARLIGALRELDPDGLEPPPWLHYDHTDATRVWPPAASDRWDPHRIESELPLALIEIARRARTRLLASNLPSVVGHTDLNGLNVRWVGDRPIVHDWDSVAARPEAVLVGTLAVDHVALPDRGRIAGVAAGERVIAAYEDESGRAFTVDEREVAWAASAWLASYNAAFEHLHGGPGEVTAQLLVDGEQRLARAGA